MAKIDKKLPNEDGKIFDLSFPTVSEKSANNSRCYVLGLYLALWIKHFITTDATDRWKFLVIKLLWASFWG